jgi:hypothetical protein
MVLSDRPMGTGSECLIRDTRVIVHARDHDVSLGCRLAKVVDHLAAAVVGRTDPKYERVRPQAVNAIDCRHEIIDFGNNLNVPFAIEQEAKAAAYWGMILSHHSDLRRVARTAFIEIRH